MLCADRSEPTSCSRVATPQARERLGGEQQVGQGWRMLMSALAAGRGISLPSLSAAGAAFAARTTGAYARVRQQFGIPIGKFEGVQECLGRLAGTAYLLDEMLALEGADEKEALAAFDKAFWRHGGHSPKTLFRALGRSWTMGMFAPAPDAGKAARHYRQLGRELRADRGSGAAHAWRLAQAKGDAVRPAR